MKTYVILTNLTDAGRKTVKQYPHRIKQVNKALEGLGVKIVAQYALLGEFDFLSVVEAKDDKALLKVAMEMGSRGTVRTYSIPAIPIDEFIKDFKGMK